jgi:hypothetical protein
VAPELARGGDRRRDGLDLRRRRRRDPLRVRAQLQRDVPAARVGRLLRAVLTDLHLRADRARARVQAARPLRT